MNFYVLTAPDYRTEKQFEAANPLRQVDELAMPGLICSECHEVWAGSRRVYLPVNDPALAKRLNGLPLPTEEWLHLEKLLRQSLNLPPRFVLQPGDVFGVPSFELLSANIPDIMHPFPGQVVVSNNVLEGLAATRFTGFTMVRCQTRWMPALKRKLPSDQPLPKLFELAVEGTAWREGMSVENSVVCQKCQRTVFPDPNHLAIDTQRWDGSDFFHVDNNPNIVMVAEQVCMFLAQRKYEYYRCAKNIPNLSADQP